MKADMHNNFTQNQLLAKEYFEEIGFICTSKEKESLLIMSGILMIDDNSCEIIAIIYPQFPLVYPKFHIKKQEWFLKYPHVEQENQYGNGLCIIEEKNKQYYENINLILNDQITQLEEFLHKLYHKQLNQNEVFDEFESYWNNSKLTPVYMSPKYLSSSGLYYGYDYKKNYYVLDKLENIQNFFNASNTPISEISFLYFHFDLKLDNIPTTYKEFYLLIKSSNQLALLHKYMNSIKISNLLTFSFLLPNNKRFYAGIYINNFTKHKTSYPYYRIFKNKIQYHKKLLGFTMKSVQKERLYNRGGNKVSEELSKKNKSIAIIGCGSVGSSLAYKLLKSGITNFTLIDSQKLSVDNINRHLLGQEYVGINKATATKQYLEKQLIDCTIKDISHHAEEHLDELKDVDLIILALADDAPIIEEEISRQSRENRLPKTIILWLEAHALAGHAIMPNQIKNYTSIQDIAQEIATLKASYAQSFLKSDMGCNGSYMPYTFIDADQHLNSFAKMILKFLNTGNTDSIISSIGDMNNVPKEFLNNSFNSNTIIQRKNIA